LASSTDTIVDLLSTVDLENAIKIDLEQSRPESSYYQSLIDDFDRLKGLVNFDNQRSV
jgi:hypothetical protein